MKFYLLVLPALALAVATANAATPTASVPVSNVYKAPIPEPVPTAVVTPLQPVHPQQPHIVLPQPQAQPHPEPLTSFEMIDDDDDEPGFIVQNGFDGYIIPSDIIPKTELPVAIPALAGLFGLIKLPKFLLALSPLFGNGLLALGALGAIGAALCAFTPLCTLTFLRGEQIRDALKSETAKSAAEFVTNAIDKYRTLAKKIEDAAAENVARKNAAKISNGSKNERR